VGTATGGGARLTTAGTGTVAVTPRPLGDLLLSTALMRGLTAAQVAEFTSVCRQRRFAPGELILREGDQDPFAYILVDGLARLTKHTSLVDDPITMGVLRAGDILGELKIVDPQPSSASVVAITPVAAVEIDLDAFASSAAFAATRAAVLGNIGKILAARLRATTGQGADALERELEASRARAHAARFIVWMFAMVAIFQIALSALVLVPVIARPANSILSIIFVIWTVVPIALSLRRGAFPLESYGLTMRRASGHSTAFYPSAGRADQLEGDPRFQLVIRLGALLPRPVVRPGGVRAWAFLGLDVRQAAFADRRHCFSCLGRPLGDLRARRACDPRWGLVRDRRCWNFSCAAANL
jgi:CRP/FNR family transcriptional regulator, cyclic AMP receptor protein